MTGNTKLPINKLIPNPENPRVIKDDKFKKLVQSLKDFPEMADIREVVVNKEYVILGGNMRYKAMQAAGWTEVPVKIVDWPEEKQREFIIKDNVSGGEWDWDVLANDWDTNLLDDWGMDLLPSWGAEDIIEKPPTKSEDLYTVVIVAYNDIEDLDRITSLYELDSQEITDEIKSQVSSQRKIYVFKK